MTFAMKDASPNTRNGSSPIAEPIAFPTCSLAVSIARSTFWTAPFAFIGRRSSLWSSPRPFGFGNVAAMSDSKDHRGIGATLRVQPDRRRHLFDRRQIGALPPLRIHAIGEGEAP